MAGVPEVSVIIPTLRSGHDLLRALDSLAADKEAPSQEVLVVFNAPKPDDIKLEAHHSNARAIAAPTNLGFAGACDLGSRDASGRTLAFMNDDMTVKPGWIARLLGAMEENNCRAVGGRILSEDGKKIDFAGGSVNLLGWGFQVGHGETVDEEDFVPHQWLPFACGGNFAIRADLFRESGGFDERYFAFYEDVDLGWRLRLMGEDIAYAHEAVALHASGATGSLLPSALKWFLQERNSLMTILKNYSDEVLWKVLPIAFAMTAVRAEVLSNLDANDFAPDRMWKEWILGADVPAAEIDVPGAWHGLLDSVKESLKAGMKSARKAALPPGYLSMESRSAAGLHALEWIMLHWDDLMNERGKVQSMRKRGDREILPLFDDPMRPVLGHPREIEAMKPLKGVLGELLR